MPLRCGQARAGQNNDDPPSFPAAMVKMQPYCNSIACISLIMMRKMALEICSYLRMKLAFTMQVSFGINRAAFATSTKVDKYSSTVYHKAGANTILAFLAMPTVFPPAKAATHVP
jgi:hypothetical protein